VFDNAFFDNIDEVWAGFKLTLWLLLFAGVLATVIGTVMASCRVSPIPSLRAIGTSYVNVLRNTPLVVVLVLSSALVPTLGFNSLDANLGLVKFSHFEVLATIGLSLYTGAFVCEALRSGINSVSAGQAEAARSVGMAFGQSLRHVVLPQAFRAVIPPLASVYIALAKNTSVVAVVGVAEASYTMYRLGNKFTSDIYPIFFGFALGYVVIVLVIAGVSNFLERRYVAVTR
jgi:glutamate transport system permease protein